MEYGVPLVGPITGRGLKRTREEVYLDAKTRVANRPRCQAKILREQASIITGEVSESEESCRGFAISGDILCPTHRRQTNLAAINRGVRKGGKAIFAIPAKAVENCKFPLEFLKAVSATTETKKGDEMIEPWKVDELMAAAKAFMK